MGYDKAKRLALWAAYPLHSCYTQGISRERHWGYDPTLAPGEQMAGGVSAPTTGDIRSPTPTGG